MRELTLPLIPSMVEEQKKQVALNREIVGQLIEITKYLGYHSLDWLLEVIENNGRILIKLLAKNSPFISIHVLNLQISGRKELLFISWQRQNLLINALAQEILVIIKFEIQNAKFFSISIDSTFDNKFNLSSGIQKKKKLIAIKKSIFTTGQSLFDFFIQVMEYNHLDWKTFLVGQSYDGAASKVNKMGYKQKSKRLDLIITSAVGSCAKAVDLLGNMEKLFVFISCRQVDFKTAAECTGLLCFLLSFNFLLTAHIFKTVSVYIELVSRALQTHNIDVLMAVELIKKTEKNIKCLRSSDMFYNIYELVKKFAKDNHFEFELTLPTRRVRRVPRQPGELSNDEQINDSVMNYNKKNYFVIIDKVLSELNKRFNNDSFMIVKDLSLLTIKVISKDIVRKYEQLIKSNINLISLNNDASISDSGSSNYSVVEDEFVNDSLSILKIYQIFINKSNSSETYPHDPHDHDPMIR
ncbi:hypothetical protein AGLY_002041 [Aphis glycines]|uniref:DUF4371 domain-containing protein n=1 Tax=Aphis glycines TaxID=307491 RepID=A0A6G0U3F9_APHGL|nr:hypothetical protein AGLY_002041 [Aphis glycines]